jgi:predicted dehydrogenase
MAKSKAINIGLIGHAFMGRAHSNAWTQVQRFFSPAATPIMHTVCGRNVEATREFAAKWGWRNTESDYRKLAADPQIDLVDITAQNHMHPEMAIAALEAGKHVSCEKPLARTLDEARPMLAAARKAKGKTFVWYNYRRTPAVSLAYQLAREGRLGEIRHIRGFYLQDWATPEIPLAWRFDKKIAGSGSHGDLCAHVIDMCRFVSGLEITEIDGAIFETFIKERPIQEGDVAGGLSEGLKGGSRKGKVTVDDAVAFLCRFEGGAIGQFEATRMATGNQNKVGFEINGSAGALRFNFERMNELEYYDRNLPRKVQGWQTIIVTHGADHPYAGAWWPDAHVIGYEHSFTNQAFDTLAVLGGAKPVVPLPDFNDAYQTQRVLEAAAISARERAIVKMSQVK